MHELEIKFYFVVYTSVGGLSRVFRLSCADTSSLVYTGDGIAPDEVPMMRECQGWWAPSLCCYRARAV